MGDSGQGRRQSIDLMRIVAAFGIVWFHLQAPGPFLGFLALPVFLMLTGALAWGSIERHGAVGFWRRRAGRILVPWAIWSGVYLLVDARRFGWGEVLILDDPLSLLVGPAIHLWFLPFVALMSGLAVPAARFLTDAGRVRLAAVGAALVLAVPAWFQDHGMLPPPFAQWSVAAIPFACGLLAGAGRSRGAPLAGLGMACLAALVGTLGWGSPLAPYLPLAALAFEGLWRLPVRHPWLPALGDLTYGIYCVHPLVALLWYALGGTAGAAGALAVFAGSGAFAAALDAALRIGRGALSSAGRAPTPPERARA